MWSPLGPILAPVRTGILGGTFDPIHIAHLHTAETALHQLALERVLLIPAGDPWQKAGRRISQGHHRLAMARLATDGVDGLEVDSREIDRDGPSYTIETLETFPADEDLYLIVGSDSAAGLSTWHRWEEIVERTTIVVAPRPGVSPGELGLAASVVLDMGFAGGEWHRDSVPGGEGWPVPLLGDTTGIRVHHRQPPLHRNPARTIWLGLHEVGGTEVAPSVELARAAADAIYAKNGQDIVLLDVEESFFLSDVFVIATGSSRPNVQALADHVEEKLKETFDLKPLRVEGRTEGEWVLVDYGDIIVHVFQAGPREFYSLERLVGRCREDHLGGAGRQRGLRR